MAVDFTLLGQRIRYLRKSRGMSQAKLAELTDLAVPYISHIETGKKKASLETVIKIADALGVTVDIILCGNQQCDQKEFCSDLTELLDDCNRLERQFILETAASMKSSIKKYSIMLEHYKR